MLFVERAIFIQQKTVCSILFVLFSGVISLFTYGAFESNNFSVLTFSHYNSAPLFYDFSHYTGTDGTTTFADGEAEVVIDCNRVDQGNIHFNFIAGHCHFHTLGKFDLAGYIGRS
jgi:hypothetical protein